MTTSKDHIIPYASLDTIYRSTQKWLTIGIKHLSRSKTLVEALISAVIHNVTNIATQIPAGRLNEIISLAAEPDLGAVEAGDQDTLVRLDCTNSSVVKIISHLVGIVDIDISPRITDVLVAERWILLVATQKLLDCIVFVVDLEIVNEILAVFGD